MFGARCWYVFLATKVKQLDARTREAMLIGYKLWDPELKRVIASKSVMYDEGKEELKLNHVFHHHLILYLYQVRSNSAIRNRT